MVGFDVFVVEPSSKEPQPLTGRNAILKERKNDHFVDVGFGRGVDNKKDVFAVTKTGLLCAFNQQRQLVKWIDLKVKFVSSGWFPKHNSLETPQIIKYLVVICEETRPVLLGPDHCGRRSDDSSPLSIWDGAVMQIRLKAHNEVIINGMLFRLFP